MIYSMYFLLFLITPTIKTIPRKICNLLYLPFNDFCYSSITLSNGVNTNCCVFGLSILIILWYTIFFAKISYCSVNLLSCPFRKFLCLMTIRKCLIVVYWWDARYVWSIPAGVCRICTYDVNNNIYSVIVHCCTKMSLSLNISKLNWD